jgi:Integrase core domain
VILDAYARAVRGWHLSRSPEQELVLAALDTASPKGKPLIHHSDQGSQYAAWLHTENLLEANIRISLSPTGKPQQNGRVERFFRTLKEELIDFIECRDFDEAWLALEPWLEVAYTTRHIHSALDDATPAEFEAAYLQHLSSRTSALSKISRPVQPGYLGTARHQTQFLSLAAVPVRLPGLSMRLLITIRQMYRNLVDAKLKSKVD